jgi:predicted nucleic acid-binding protein
MRIAIDTNVLAYAEGVNGVSLKKTALEVVQALPPSSTFLPVQALGELFHVLVRKAGWKRGRAQTAILAWQDSFPLIETSPAVLVAAMDLAAHHGLGIWDSVIFSAAAASGCRLLLSEDMQNGFTWNGVTVVNPFVSVKHDLLAALLKPLP